MWFLMKSFRRLIFIIFVKDFYYYWSIYVIFGNLFRISNRWIFYNVDIKLNNFRATLMYMYTQLKLADCKTEILIFLHSSNIQYFDQFLKEKVTIIHNKKRSKLLQIKNDAFILIQYTTYFSGNVVVFFRRINLFYGNDNCVS